ncbi:MAG: fibro-slime domain-containing protein [Oscillospiraceae bacterium]|jgi:fibro-slime domain-containing protein|nr:fibro-slime domain-containing protein [Oscillospiraceae bacterium]
MKTLKFARERAGIRRGRRFVALLLPLVMSVALFTQTGVTFFARAGIVESENGIPGMPASFLRNDPPAINLPVTFWDQLQDRPPNRLAGSVPDFQPEPGTGLLGPQFEWGWYNYNEGTGLQQGLVAPFLDPDGLPMPAGVAVSPDPQFIFNPNIRATNHYIYALTEYGEFPCYPGTTWDDWYPESIDDYRNPDKNNFYRWFHEVLSPRYTDEMKAATAPGLIAANGGIPGITGIAATTSLTAGLASPSTLGVGGNKSLRIDGKGIPFSLTKNNTYVFQRDSSDGTGAYGFGFFPLDDVKFSYGDISIKKAGPGSSQIKRDIFNPANAADGYHNYHYTMHAGSEFVFDGTEPLSFSFFGDDDVWLFIDGHLALDIGGVHSQLSGTVNIEADGELTSVVYDRPAGLPTGAYENSPENYGILTSGVRGAAPGQTLLSLTPGEHRWDLFYAERNTTDANIRIETNMLMGPDVLKTVEPGKAGGSEYRVRVANSFGEPIEITHIADWFNPGEYITGDGGYYPFDGSQGYIAFDGTYFSELEYSTDDGETWTVAELTTHEDGSGNLDGSYALGTPVRLAARGAANSEAEFRYTRYAGNPEPGSDEYGGWHYNQFSVFVRGTDADFTDRGYGRVVENMPAPPVLGRFSLTKKISASVTDIAGALNNAEYTFSVYDSGDNPLLLSGDMPVSETGGEYYSAGYVEFSETDGEPDGYVDAEYGTFKLKAGGTATVYGALGEEYSVYEDGSALYSAGGNPLTLQAGTIRGWVYPEGTAVVGGDSDGTVTNTLNTGSFTLTKALPVRDGRDTSGDPYKVAVIAVNGNPAGTAYLKFTANGDNAYKYAGLTTTMPAPEALPGVSPGVLGAPGTPVVFTGIPYGVVIMVAESDDRTGTASASAGGYYSAVYSGNNGAAVIGASPFNIAITNLLSTVTVPSVEPSPSPGGEPSPSPSPSAEPSAEPPVSPAPPSAPPNHTLTPSGDGASYTELDENGEPLGEWRYDPDADGWVFTEYPSPLGDVPTTGDPGADAPIALFALAVGITALIAARKRRRGGNRRQ